MLITKWKQPSRKGCMPLIRLSRWTQRRSKAQKLQGCGEGLTVRSCRGGMSRHSKRNAFVDPVSANAHHYASVWAVECLTPRVVPSEAIDLRLSDEPVSSLVITSVPSWWRIWQQRRLCICGEKKYTGNFRSPYSVLLWALIIKLKFTKIL